MTDELLKGQVLTGVGDAGKNATYRLILPLSTAGGTLALSFVGHVTAPIPYPPTKEQIRAALAALIPIASETNVLVEGVRGGPFQIALTGELGAQVLPLAQYPFLADGTNLVPQANLHIEQTEVGRTQVLKNKLEQLWEGYIAVTDSALRALYCKRDLLKDLRAEAQKYVDTATNERRESASQQFRNLTTLYQECLDEINAATGGNAWGMGAPTQAVLVGRIERRTPNGAAYGEMVYDEETGVYY